MKATEQNFAMVLFMLQKVVLTEILRLGICKQASSVVFFAFGFFVCFHFFQIDNMEIAALHNTREKLVRV